MTFRKANAAYSPIRQIIIASFSKRVFRAERVPTAYDRDVNIYTVRFETVELSNE